MTSAEPPRAPWWRDATRPAVVRGALQVSVVVGVILNLVNQGGTMLRGGAIDWPHLALNFAVPYCVATFSAVRAGRERVRPPRA